MKRITRILLLSITASLLLCACAKKPENTHNGVVVIDSLKDKPVLVGDIPSTFPLEKEPKTLNIMAFGFDKYPLENVFVWQKYKEMTGVDVKWTTLARDERTEAVNTALTNRQNLDLIMRCKISATALTRYGENGLILDLAKDGLLEKNAPNCWAFLQSHPQALASITNPDGTIYSLPQINSGAELRVALKIFINKNWLEKLNLSIPTTTEEFYQMLKAFRDLDANGNGNPNDEIPLSGANWQSIQQSFYGAFGLMNRGFHNDTMDFDEATGKVRLIAAADGYRDFLDYMHTLYSEKLLDNYIFTMTDEQWANNIANDVVGVYPSTNLAWLPADKLDNWVAIEEALEGPNGDKMWTAIRADFHSVGAAVIPATCSDPALVLRWLDYFWTDEGTLFYHMGIDGETFEPKEDGTYDYLPKIYEEMVTNNQSFDQVISKYSPYPGGSNPTVEIAPYFGGGEMAPVPASAARSLLDYGPKEYWPSFTFTDDENETLTTIQSDISKYRSSSWVEFINGDRPLSDWDAYLKQMDDLELQDLLDIYQAAVDRYNTAKENK